MPATSTAPTPAPTPPQLASLTAPQLPPTPAETRPPTPGTLSSRPSASPPRAALRERPAVSSLCTSRGPPAPPSAPPPHSTLKPSLSPRASPPAGGWPIARRAPPRLPIPRPPAWPHRVAQSIAAREWARPHSRYPEPRQTRSKNPRHPPQGPLPTPAIPAHHPSAPRRQVCAADRTLVVPCGPSRGRDAAPSLLGAPPHRGGSLHPCRLSCHSSYRCPPCSPPPRPCYCSRRLLVAHRRARRTRGSGRRTTTVTTIAPQPGPRGYFAPL